MKINTALFVILFLCTGIKGIIDPSASPPEEDITSQPPEEDTTSHQTPQEELTEGPSPPPQVQYPLQYPAKIHPHGFCPTYEEMVNLTNEFRQNISELLKTHRICGGTPGWRRVAYLDMTDPSQSCPPGLALRVYSGVRACEPLTMVNHCSSSFYMTGDAEYTKVCGRVRGYQYGGTAWAFYSATYDGQGIDGYYVSGVSLTHGQSGSRTHIWTFAASLEEIVTSSPYLVCPCVSAESISLLPDFVGSGYFCESGTETWTGEYNILYSDDPLWDGQNCANSCCEFNNPPYFTKTLPTPTTDDIELRLCSRFTSYKVPIDQVEIYVQ